MYKPPIIINFIKSLHTNYRFARPQVYSNCSLLTVFVFTKLWASGYEQVVGNFIVLEILQNNVDSPINRKNYLIKGQVFSI